MNDYYVHLKLPLYLGQQVSEHEFIANRIKADTVDSAIDLVCKRYEIERDQLRHVSAWKWEH